MHIFCKLRNIWWDSKISKSIIFIEFSVCMAVNKILNSLVTVKCCYQIISSFLICQPGLVLFVLTLSKKK